MLHNLQGQPQRERKATCRTTNVVVNPAGDPPRSWQRRACTYSPPRLFRDPSKSIPGRLGRQLSYPELLVAGWVWPRGSGPPVMDSLDEKDESKRSSRPYARNSSERTGSARLKLTASGRC